METLLNSTNTENIDSKHFTGLHGYQFVRVIDDQPYFFSSEKTESGEFSNFIQTVRSYTLSNSEKKIVINIYSDLITMEFDVNGDINHVSENLTELVNNTNKNLDKKAIDYLQENDFDSIEINLEYNQKIKEFNLR